MRVLVPVSDAVVVVPGARRGAVVHDLAVPQHDGAGDERLPDAPAPEGVRTAVWSMMTSPSPAFEKVISAASSPAR